MAFQIKRHNEITLGEPLSALKYRLLNTDVKSKESVDIFFSIPGCYQHHHDCDQCWPPVTLLGCADHINDTIVKTHCSQGLSNKDLAIRIKW